MRKIGIVCASDEELAPFLQHIESVIVTNKAMLKFYEGHIKGMQVVALYSGVCKVNAAIATQLLIDTYSVVAVLNVGVAGGMDSKVELFDTVISTQTTYHDVEEEILTEFHPWLSSIYFETDKNLLKIARRIFDKCPTIHFGRMITGENFIEGDMRDSLNAKYSPISVDMETASIAHVCYVNAIPFMAIRSISDTAGHNGIENFENNCKQASNVAKDVTLTFLKHLDSFII
ncbi:MAG: 5'-methylthioadenosine/adenosylhomocysteine nucleosidase [Coprobacillus sp.]